METSFSSFNSNLNIPFPSIPQDPIEEKIQFTAQQIALIKVPPPQPGKPVSSAMKKASLDRESGCVSLGRTLLVHIIDCYQQLNVQEVRKWMRSKKKGDDPYLKLPSLLRSALRTMTAFLVESEGLIEKQTKEIHFLKAKNALQEARLLVQIPSQTQVPTQIIQFTQALKLLEIQIGVDREALTRPMGTDIQPETVVNSFKRYLRILNKLLQESFFSMFPLGELDSFKQEMQSLLKLLESQLIKSEQKNEFHEVKSEIYLTFEKVYNLYLENQSKLENQKAYDCSDAAAFWIIAFNVALHGASDEIRRFLYSSRAESQQLSKEDLIHFYHHCIRILELTLKTVESRPLETDSNTEKNQPLWEEWLLLNQTIVDSLKSTALGLQLTVQTLEKTPIDSSPAVLGSYLYSMDMQFGDISDSFQALSLWLKYNTQYALLSPQFSEEATMRITLLEQLILTTQKPLLDFLPIFAIKSTLPKTKKITKNLSSSKKAISHKLLSPVKEEGISQNTLLIQQLLESLHMMAQKPIHSPHFDEMFRMQWREKCVATLQTSFHHCLELEKKEDSYDAAWETLYLLHRILETSLDLALVHYPLQEQNHHILNVPTHSNEEKTLKEYHQLGILVKMLLTHQEHLPLPLQNLLVTDKEILRKLSRANTFSTYPHWNISRLSPFSHHYPDQETFLNFVRDLTERVNEEQREWILQKDYKDPVFSFVSDLLKILNANENIFITSPSFLAYEWEEINENHEVEEKISLIEMLSATSDPTSSYMPLEHRPKSRKDALNTVLFCENMLSIHLNTPVFGKQEIEWRTQRRNEALNHCLIYLTRLKEKFSSLNGSPFTYSLEALQLTHRLMKEMYVAALAHLPCYDEHQVHYLNLYPQNKNHYLRLENDIFLLHRLWKKFAHQFHVISQQSLYVIDPSETEWPFGAQILLKHFGSLHMQNIPFQKEQLPLRNHLQKLYELGVPTQITAKGEDYQQQVLEATFHTETTYLFPALKLISNFLVLGFRNPQNNR